ncbi:hypothetical protein NCCP2495_32040 [Dietzia sp. NCCP-2495]|nr:hypothetical protein NCCP2495_32040 [Dietzia sp. NCCP-2495]
MRVADFVVYGATPGPAAVGAAGRSVLSVLPVQSLPHCPCHTRPFQQLRSATREILLPDSGWRISAFPGFGFMSITTLVA